MSSVGCGLIALMSQSSGDRRAQGAENFIAGHIASESAFLLSFDAGKRKCEVYCQMRRAIVDRRTRLCVTGGSRDTLEVALSCVTVLTPIAFR